VARYKKLVQKETGKPFPQDPVQQLRMSRDAVFRSWNNQRAIAYRRIYEIPDHIGTAVNVQQMVFGNTGDRSATGVGFTRNPARARRSSSASSSSTPRARTWWPASGRRGPSPSWPR